mmetsp:Transcript_13212/g.26048  ORF Transcript_13212/g.26048 Transcript_13212/m.26048 type:complete len:92 (+) Transcript_13212:391-666(+)
MAVWEFKSQGRLEGRQGGRVGRREGGIHLVTDLFFGMLYRRLLGHGMLSVPSCAVLDGIKCAFRFVRFPSFVPPTSQTVKWQGGRKEAAEA